MEIRRLHPHDDLDAAGAVVRNAYFSLADYPRDDVYDVVIGDIRSRVHEADIVAAIDDGRIVGCLTFVPSHENVHAEFTDPDAASVRYFGVDPATAGRGVGAAMMQWTIAEARRLGRGRIRLHTLTMMHAAQRLYERLGFVRDPAEDADWDGVVGLAYRLDL